MKPTLAALHQAWIDESEMMFEDDDDRDAAECAEPPDVVYEATDAAWDDPAWDETVYEWDVFLFQKSLRLALERSCCQAVLLPDDLRATRLVTCPPAMVNGLKTFFEQCPRHVMLYLVFYNYHLVRIERARRTGSPEWKPSI